MIDSLGYKYETEYIQETIDFLSNQFEVSASAEWSKDDLNNYVFDNDLLDTLHNQGYVIYDDFLEDICIVPVLQLMSYNFKINNRTQHNHSLPSPIVLSFLFYNSIDLTHNTSRLNSKS